MRRAGNSAAASLLWSALILLGSSGAAMAQRELTNIPVPDPSEELRSFTVAEGFEVNLFAADPQIHKPIQINFDPQGRLWVAASEIYPQIAPGQVANDKILILSDEDGDGVADKTQVFADGLLIPTGVEPGDGGAYVANSTELLHLVDTNGDDRADESRILLSGFGTEDTHHIIHTFRWGPEGLFYFNQSIYIHSHVETPYGVQRLNAGGIWQFRPETLQLNVLARGWVNTWGHTFDRWGQSFVTDGAGGEGINYLVPGASYATAYGAARILHGLNPGSPKYCGLEMVDGQHLPEDWQGNLITHDFRGHRVCRFSLTDNGSGFAARQMPDVISTDHVAFRPVDVKQGPDGAIYIADWYNPIIQHGEVDFRDPRRDHTHGRIWRLTAKNRPLVPRPQLVSATIPALLEQLKSTETFTRQHAKRVLKERGAEAVLPALQRWWQSLSKSDPDYEHHLLEALWVAQAIDVPQPELLQRVLQSPDSRARAAALRVVPHWADRLNEPTSLLMGFTLDAQPRVRMEAIRAWAAFPSLQAAEQAAAAVDLPLDENLDYALWQMLRESKAEWVAAAARGQFRDDGRLSRLLFAIKAAEAVEAIPHVVQRLSSPSLSANDRTAALQVIALLGAPEHLQVVWDLALDEATSNELRQELLLALADSQSRRNVRPPERLSRSIELLSNRPTAIVLAALDCIRVWKLAEAEPAVTAVLKSDSAELAVRTAAIQALASIGSPAVKPQLQELIESSQKDELAVTAITAMVGLEPAQAARLTVPWLQRSTDASQQSRVFTAFLQAKGAATELASALKDVKLPADVAKIGLRVITGSGRTEDMLTAALTTAGGISGSPTPPTPEELAALVQSVRSQGNAAHGEALFRRADLACQKCHAIGGAGGKVGPDLISIGASAQIDYLIDSMLAPNKNIKEGYQTIVVQTDAGQVLSGVKVRETETHLIVRDAEDREVAIPLASIEEQSSGSSLMPAGLTEKLTRAELIDLTRFLSELGKPGPYAVSTVPTARRWHALLPTKESYTRMTRTSDAQLMSSDDQLQWTTVYSQVDGSLPLPGLPDFTLDLKFVDNKRHVAFVRTEVQVSQPGVVLVELNDAEHLEFWQDGQPVSPASRMAIPVTPGVHRWAFAIDLRHRRTPLKLTLPPSSDSTAQVQFLVNP
jgi:putative heme-binding domain-containing protein